MKKLFLFIACFALSAAAQAQPAQTEAARQYLQAHAKQHGITGSALAEAVVTDAYTSRHNGATHVYLQQPRNATPVVDALTHVNCTADGRVLLAGGTFVPGLESRSLAAAPSLGAVNAAEAALQHLGITPTQPISVETRAAGAAQSTYLTDAGIARLPIMAKLVYQPV